MPQGAFLPNKVGVVRSTQIENPSHGEATDCLLPLPPKQKVLREARQRCLKAVADEARIFREANISEARGGTDA